MARALALAVLSEPSATLNFDNFSLKQQAALQETEHLDCFEQALHYLK